MIAVQPSFVRFLHFLISGSLIFVLQSCQTIGENEQGSPPKITSDMDADDLMEAGITYGGDTLRQAKEEIAARKLTGEVAPKIRKWLFKFKSEDSKQSLLNATNIYLATHANLDIELLEHLLKARIQNLFVSGGIWDLCVLTGK